MKKQTFSADLSKKYCREFDKVGFDKKESLERISFMKKLSEAKNRANRQILGQGDCQIEKILVGSQSDGTGVIHNNDLDILQIDHAVVCQNEVDYTEIGNDKVVFQTDQRNAPPGYVYLRLLKGEGETYKELEHALVERNDGKYLSSNSYLSRQEDVSQNSNGCIGQITEHLSRAGPSLPKYIKQSSEAAWILSCLNLHAMDTDVVWAFPYLALPIMEEWANRERKSGWPSKETIANVARLPAHVVPVGQRGTDDEDLQWRICFTLGEILLVQNFNDVQRKLFVMMKLIARHFLKPICNDISSYVIKNVIFWISEEIPQEQFKEENFLEILQEALTYLLQAIKRKTLQNYMIPSRNLFEAKFKENDFCIPNLTQAILKCINEPEKLFLKMEPFFSNLKMGHLIGITERTILDSLSTEELVAMYVLMNSCQSQESMIQLNILYKAIPFWNIFGKAWFYKHTSPTDTKYFESHIEHYTQSDLEKWLNSSSSLTLNQEVMDYEDPWPQWSLFELSYICPITTLLYII